MTGIHVDTTAFAAAAALTALLSRRRLVQETHPGVLVCSAACERALGGTTQVIERARAQQARHIIIVSEGAELPGVHSREMGGRLIRYGLGTPGCTPLRDGDLLMLADLVAAPCEAMVSCDERTGQLLDLVARVAAADVTVLINGPTGSGKEVLARTIHLRSARAAQPFVAINCAAIPENMLEAMLFGHEKGAFTGAATANKGIFRAAEGGTLLLDEISEMPLGLQAKILRVLQERRVTPLGAQKEVPVDVRLVATTNRDMGREVRENRFREDLFYRLNVFPLTTLPLAARPDDILPLAVSLLRRHCPEDRDLPRLDPAAADLLLSHSWPGNVRELENVMQRALVLCSGGRIGAADIILDPGISLSLAPALPPAMLPRQPERATAS
ncbi:sigma-54 interaction domain-containing protein [Plastorhodobacter daqingensis]|uniref:Sigma-54 interaction domain-containing protein n=1 Tax=Plastorhodobacter daqingensis TaxID=1387281 RepID=A0ABW2UKZ6_9RHOB